jgi:hypothetical protein
MFCGRCGNDEVRSVVEETEQNGNYIIVRYYGKCDVCGEVLGQEEVFKLTSIYTLSREDAKKALDKAGKL